MFNEGDTVIVEFGWRSSEPSDIGRVIRTTKTQAIVEYPGFAGRKLESRFNRESGCEISSYDRKSIRAATPELIEIVRARKARRAAYNYIEGINWKEFDRNGDETLQEVAAAIRSILRRHENPAPVARTWDFTVSEPADPSVGLPELAERISIVITPCNEDAEVISDLLDNIESTLHRHWPDATLTGPEEVKGR